MTATVLIVVPIAESRDDEPRMLFVSRAYAESRVGQLTDADLEVTPTPSTPRVDTWIDYEAGVRVEHVYEEAQFAWAVVARSL